VGGGLILLGWLVPWVSVGGVIRGITSLLGVGSSGLGISSGVGNGLQMALLSVSAGFLAFSAKEGIVVLLGLLLLANAGVLISIPIVAVQILRAGFSSFQQSSFQSAVIRDNLEQVRGKAVYLFVILAILFILLASIPFGTAVLGTGFYLCLMGSIVTYVGAYYMRDRIPG
jgi:hypothetical protein